MRCQCGTALTRATCTRSSASAWSPVRRYAERTSAARRATTNSSNPPGASRCDTTAPPPEPETGGEQDGDAGAGDHPRVERPWWLRSVDDRSREQVAGPLDVFDALPGQGHQGRGRPGRGVHLVDPVTNPAPGPRQVSRHGEV